MNGREVGETCQSPPHTLRHPRRLTHGQVTGQSQRSEGVITDTWTLWLTETRPVCLTGSSEPNFCSENVNVSRVYSSISVSLFVQHHHRSEASLIKLEQRSVAS